MDQFKYDGCNLVNSAAVKQQKREARLDFLAAAIGWSIIAAINYLLFSGFFWILANPLSTWSF
jgi:hypothetical protein